jgi:hypothetical protein
MANDRWTGGDDYERYMGRWSRAVEDRFLDWLAIPDDRNFDDYRSPLRTGVGPAAGYGVGLNEASRWGWTRSSPAASSVGNCRRSASRSCAAARILKREHAD